MLFQYILLIYAKNRFNKIFLFLKYSKNFLSEHSFLFLPFRIKKKDYLLGHHCERNVKERQWRSHVKQKIFKSFSLRQLKSPSLTWKGKESKKALRILFYF